MSIQPNPHAFYIKQLRHRIGKHSSRMAEATFLAQEVRERLLERLQLIRLEPKTILDISGGMASLLQTRYPNAHIITVDIAEARLPKQSLRWWPFRRKQHPALCADMHRLPLADNAVDFIFSNCILYQAYDMPVLLKEWHRVLKPGGLVLFATLGPDTLKELRQACSEVSAMTHTQSFIDMHDIGDMLLRAGFADPVMDMEYITIYYQTVNKLLRDLQSQNTLNVSPERPRGLIGKWYWQRVAAAYDAVKSQDRLPVTCEILYGHAWVTEKKPQGEVSVPLSALRRSNTSVVPRTPQAQ